MNTACWTTRTDYYKDQPEGDLLYGGLSGLTLERTTAGVRIKEKFSKRMGWGTISYLMSDDILFVYRWMLDLKKNHGFTQFSQIPSHERPELPKGPATPGIDPDLYAYSHDEKNWVMYENDTDYLFLFEVSKDNRYMGTTDEIDCLGFAPLDCLTDLRCYLDSLYNKVKGDPKENIPTD